MLYILKLKIIKIIKITKLKNNLYYLFKLKHHSQKKEKLKVAIEIILIVIALYNIVIIIGEKSCNCTFSKNKRNMMLNFFVYLLSG